MRSSLRLQQDVIQWDVVNWSRALSLWNRVLLQSSGTALELGARRGGLSLWLALSGYDVVCSDLTDAQASACVLHKRYDVGERIRYEEIDALHIPYREHFDVIAFKSLLGGVAQDGDVEPQYRAVAGIRDALKPGGVLLFAENLRGSALHQTLRRRFVPWNDRWRYVALDEMLAFLKPFAAVEYQTTGFLGLCGRRPLAANALGLLDGLIFDRVTPPSQRYIVYGAAWK
jgi:SAM-dependent methyltransferase